MRTVEYEIERIKIGGGDEGDISSGDEDAE